MARKESLGESGGRNTLHPRTQVAKDHGMEVGKIIRSPIDDLVAFHEEELAKK